ncbi:MAG: AAA family ATPase, partial [Candidatus Aenigmarchaeota archaeon]|nr:AAA family ATPase [Candidatus Aenigmarchaeota archaeon]
MTRIKKLSMKGVRGVKTDLSLMLDGNSVLLYGDNGSGKSSITDAIEWFYYDKIEHLSSEEIGRSCLDAIRNTFLGNEENSNVSFEFTDSVLNANKDIYLKRGKLICSCSNECNEFNDFLESSKKERLILRYKDLLNFVIATKKERLDEFSNIIGFSKVTEIRGLFKTIVNDLNTEMDIKNFDNQRNIQQKDIIAKLGRNVTSDGQFIESINELIKPLNLGKTIGKLDEIDTLLESITKPEDEKIIEIQAFYKSVSDEISNFPNLLNKIDGTYKIYYEKFQKIVTDAEKINKIMLETLLSEGITVLRGKIIIEDNCPLCLQPKNRVELLRELESRITELSKVKKEKMELNTFKETLEKIIDKPNNIINGFLSHKNMKGEENRELKLKLQ